MNDENTGELDGDQERRLISLEKRKRKRREKKRKEKKWNQEH